MREPVGFVSIWPLKSRQKAHFFVLHCSANWVGEIRWVPLAALVRYCWTLHALNDSGWSHLSGSNRRPDDYKSTALPAELRWPVLLDRGLEPRTNWLRVNCSTNWANPAGMYLEIRKNWTATHANFWLPVKWSIFLFFGCFFEDLAWNVFSLNVLFWTQPSHRNGLLS